MWALQQVPIDLMNNPDIRGVEFKVQFNGQDLYTGKVSSRNGQPAAGVLEHRGVQSGDSSLVASEQNRKGLLSKPSNTSAKSLSLADHLLADGRYAVYYRFAGLPLRDIDMFSFILRYILLLAAEDVRQVVDYAWFTPSTSSIWSFASQPDPQRSTQTMHPYHVVMMLVGAAEFCIKHGIYEELLIQLWMNEALLVSGCVVRALDGRQWCKGLASTPALSLDLS